MVAHFVSSLHQVAKVHFDQITLLLLATELAFIDPTQEHPEVYIGAGGGIASGPGAGEQHPHRFGVGLEPIYRRGNKVIHQLDFLER